MIIKVLKNTIDPAVLMMTLLYDTDAKIVGETDNFYIFEYTDKTVPGLIEEHADMFPNFTQEILGLYAKNMETKITRQINNLLDSTAASYGYEDMKSARSYTGFDNPFREECLRLAIWGTSCWDKARELKEAFYRGELEEVSVEYVMGQMPQFDPNADVSGV